jgi:dTMP kinase
MPNLKKGLLITIEGIDGVGKTTQVKMLVAYLKEKGYDVVHLREPTEGFWGKKIKDQVKHGRTISPKEECEWFLKDRQEDVHENIKPALEDKKVVVMDRYYYSTMAYQGALGLNVNKIMEENEKFAPRPDLVIILDAPPEIGLTRITNNRKEELNYFEKLDYQNKVRDIFLEMKDYDYVKILDAGKDLEKVQEDIGRVVEELLQNFLT